MQITAAKLLVKTLSKDDLDCRNFENPSIQTFFTRLQEIALTERHMEPIEDLLLPDEEGMIKHAGEMITLFKQEIGSNQGKAMRNEENEAQERVSSKGFCIIYSLKIEYRFILYNIYFIILLGTRERESRHPRSSWRKRRLKK